ncbi:hypothetical protein BH24ACT26_BH24ACT26_03490 [soil metagenome]
MVGDVWQTVLVAALAINAVLGLGYRVYRLSRGGPMADVTGQAILAAALGAIASGVAVGAGWSRWAALAYGLLFGIVVMPVWTLAVFIPMRPDAVDKGYASVYWTSLAVIVVAALLVA